MLFSSIAVLNGCGENCHPSLTDRSEAQALPQALSTAKVFINWAACARWKMAICSVNMLSVDSGREGEMVVETGKRKGGLARKKGRDRWEWRECEDMRVWKEQREKRERPWASVVKRKSWNVRRTFQGYASRLCHFWESILSPCTTAITHQPVNDTSFKVHVQYVSGCLSVQQHWKHI